MQKPFLNEYFPKLKRVRQKTDAYCGPAVIEMLASYIGANVNQNKLVKLTKLEKKIANYGMNIDDLKKATKVVIPSGVFWYKEKATVMDLDKLINLYKYPVGVEWQGVFDNPDEDDGHYSVVTYINKEKNVLFLSDPFRRYAKIDREFKIDFFRKRWWDENIVKDPKTRRNIVKKDVRTLFIITPNDEKFPGKLGMTRD